MPKMHSFGPRRLTRVADARAPDVRATVTTTRMWFLAGVLPLLAIGLGCGGESAPAEDLVGEWVGTSVSEQMDPSRLQRAGGW